MSGAGIPLVETDDRRKTAKDARTQCQERAVIVSKPAARRRRSDWIRAREMRAAEAEANKAAELSCS